MKLPRLLAGVVVAGLAISACHEDSDQPSADQLSSFARQYVGMQFGNTAYNAKALNSAPGNIANQSFNRLFNSATTSGGRKSEDGDTVVYENPWVWETCAIITNTNNNDGSTTTSYDYGDGCFEGYELYKYWLHGKYTYTNKYDHQQNGPVYTDEYLYNYVSDNYGGTYYWDDTVSWRSNGYSNYEGKSTYNEKDNTYSGRYAYDHNEDYTWGDQRYTYSGHGISTYNENRSVIEERESTQVGQDGYYYRTTVLTPLVQRWDCYSNWYKQNAIGADVAFCWFPVYVSGRELVRYKQDGVEGSFIIDYGDGTCDSEITIIENQIVVALDLSKKEVTRLMKK